MKLLKFIDSIIIGIKLWLVPQISEHWPKNNPDRLIKKLIWFNRPGVPSIFTLRLGIVHEWITSIAVTIIRIFKFIGNIIRLSISISRKLLILLLGIIYESNSIFEKSVYS